MEKVNNEIKKQQANIGIVRSRKKLRAKKYLIEIINFMKKPRPSFSPYPSWKKNITENIRNNLA